MISKGTYEIHYAELRANERATTENTRILSEQFVSLCQAQAHIAKMRKQHPTVTAWPVKTAYQK
jgi:hypothetical protein